MITTEREREMEIEILEGEGEGEGEGGEVKGEVEGEGEGEGEGEREGEGEGEGEGEREVPLKFIVARQYATPKRGGAGSTIRIKLGDGRQTCELYLRTELKVCVKTRRIANKNSRLFDPLPTKLCLVPTGNCSHVRAQNRDIKVPALHCLLYILLYIIS